jgi:hypothetical protein
MGKGKLQCRFCLKICRNTSGLTRHICRSTTTIAGTGSTGGSLQHSFISSQIDKQSSTTKTLIDEVEDCDLQWEDIAEDYGRPIKVTDSSQELISTMGSATTSALSKSSRLTPSSQPDIIKTFLEIEGRQAGLPIERPNNIGQGSSRHKDYRKSVSISSRFQPFKSGTDWALTKWIMRTACTKGEIDEFTKTKHLIEIHKLLSWHSGNELYSLLERLPYGLKSEWTTSQLRIQDTPYKFYHRNVLDVIRLLVGHKPFEKHMAWEPVQWWATGNLGRLYTEMHTGKWWWRTQQALPDGATIIPIILASDKTQLSQHQGDVTAWPVYLTVGNIDRETRRKHSGPGMILLGFLPIPQMDSKDEALRIKGEVYHQAMGIIMKGIHPTKYLDTRLSDAIDTRH